MKINDIVIKPILTEKATLQAQKKIYTFDNRTNGNMGPAYFYNKVLNKQNNFGPSFKKTDLSIYLLHSSNTDSSVLNNISDKVSSIKGYNLGFQKISINNNYLEVINNIKKDPNHKFLIIDEKINNNLGLFYVIKTSFNKPFVYKKKSHSQCHK